MNLKRFSSVFVVFFGWVLGPMSQATTLRALSLSQLAARADCVVVARVQTQTAEARDGLIYTRNKVRVDEVLACAEATSKRLSVGAQVSVLQLGGRLGKRTMPVLGTAPLAVGDDVVLFLLRDPQQPDAYFIAGMSQGALKRIGDDKLLSAPTAQLWDGQNLQRPHPRWLSLKALRAQVLNKKSCCAGGVNAGRTCACVQRGRSTPSENGIGAAR